jgi:hypothetical protein
MNHKDDSDPEHPTRNARSRGKHTVFSCTRASRDRGRYNSGSSTIPTPRAAVSGRAEVRPARLTPGPPDVAIDRLRPVGARNVFEAAATGVKTPTAQPPRVFQHTVAVRSRRARRRGPVVIRTAMQAKHAWRHTNRKMKADKLDLARAFAPRRSRSQRPTRRAVKGLSLDGALRPLP